PDQRQIDRPRGQDQPRTGQIVDHDPRFADRLAARSGAEVDDARDRPAEAHLAGKEIDQRQRHLGEADPALRRRLTTETAFGNDEAVAEAELALLQFPAAVLGLEQDRAARHHDVAPSILAASRDGDAVGSDIAGELQAEAAAAAPGERGLEAALSVDYFRIGGEPTDEQRAVIDAGSANGSGYCRVAVGEEAAGVDRRLIDGDWSGPGERGLVGGERDIEALPAIARQQRDGAVHAATRQAQVSDYGALTQRQIAGDRGPPDIEPLDPDLYRSAGGHDQVDHAVERAEHRLAFRFGPLAVWSRLKRDPHGLQARGRERAGKDQRGARPVIGEGRFVRESPIIDVAAGA